MSTILTPEEVKAIDDALIAEANAEVKQAQQEIKLFETESPREALARALREYNEGIQQVAERYKLRKEEIKKLASLNPDAFMKGIKLKYSRLRIERIKAAEVAKAGADTITIVATGEQL